MGIPKFFRWLSERYPLTSQLIDTSTPGSVPEFDHLYLDFNSIIHQCSHPEGVVGPIPTHEIYLSIFAYVEHLFGTIRPKKVFFLAVDGVAPRAKMNQQRGRRFRTALEARETFEKEQRKGGVSEEEWERDRFDSNCITPGTEFMAGLDEQLRYFVHKKITEDAAWRDVEVVLSGHDVPGEGEHKIMAYIRGMSDEERRGVRHCLYGLDADLIMLGLVCHDRHFCLLREEVKFGGRKTGGKQAVTSPGKTPFYLLHIGLLREYLELEFGSVKLDLERLINDLVLLCMFVGNDFLPHLPDLHIHDQALERIFDGYKAVVGDGEDPYLTDETGTIRLPRLQAVFAKLGEWEREVWERERGDVGWLNGKRDVIPVKQGGLTVTPAQRVIFEKIHDFVLSAERHISLVNDFAAGDRKFLGELTADLGLVAEWDAWEGEVNHLVIRKPARTRGVPGAAVEPIAAAVIDEDADEPPESESESESESEEEGQEAIERVLRKYARAAVQPEGTFEEREEGRVNAAMAEWRREYYRDKLGFRDPSEVRDLVKGYVQGLQWVMYYYYRGVPSWGWFYTWHYAPRVGDLTDIASLELTFDLGEPFKPFEQLMGVLPVASGTLVPTCFRELMSSPTSSIRHFYPAEFEQDMNGKKAEWEAVVKIPFIDVNVMRAAMHRVEHMLTEEERKRNSRGTSRVFAVGEGGFYASPLPGFFPALAKDGCVEKEWAPRAGSGWGFGEDSKPKRRTIDNTVMRAGFPSLKTLKHSAVLGVHGVNVHGTESRNRSIVVFIKDEPAGDLKTTLGGRVWVNWPFLREGKVVGVSDEGGRWDHTQLIAGGPSKVLRTPHNPVAWRARGERIEEVYSKKRGVVIGDVSGMLHVRLVVGMERVPETGGLVKRFAVGEVDVPGQMVVRTCPSEEDSRFVERAAVDVKEELGGKRVFFMGEHGYGGVGRVEGVDEERNEVSVVLAFGEPEPDVRVEEQGEGGRWYPSWEAAQRVGVSGRVLGRVTSAFMVVAGRDKVNVGLSFKFEARGIRVVGYSRKAANGWEFSEDAVQACRRYKDTYPVVFDVAGRAAGDMPKAEEMGGPEAVRAIKKWLKEEIGVGSLEEVPLGVERMSKEGVKKLEQTGSKGAGKVKRAMVKGIPRAAVLLPGHGRERLRGQRFGLGDRVVSVEEAAGGGLGARGIVVGIGAPETPGVGVGVGRSAASSVSVLFDAPFMAGTTLGGLCSPYRGAVMDPEGVLNLTERQFVVSVGRPKLPTQPIQQATPQVSIMPRGGARGRGNGFDERGRGRGIGSGSGFVERGRGNGFVERGRGSGFVEHARGNGFVERGRGRGNGFVDRGRGGRGRAFAPRGFMQRGGGVSSPPASASS